MKVRTKRIYEPADPADGVRVLIDRLWPRGVSKARAAIDVWPKALSPSDELRKWYRHDPEKWTEFKRRYARELDANADALADLRAEIGDADVTLVFSSKEEHLNNAEAFRLYLEKAGQKGKRAKDAGA